MKSGSEWGIELREGKNNGIHSNKWKKLDGITLFWKQVIFVCDWPGSDSHSKPYFSYWPMSRSTELSIIWLLAIFFVNSKGNIRIFSANSRECKCDKGTRDDDSVENIPEVTTIRSRMEKNSLIHQLNGDYRLIGRGGRMITFKNISHANTPVKQ